MTLLAVVGACLSAALAATLPARPEPTHDARASLAAVATDPGRGLDKLDRRRRGARPTTEGRSTNDTKHSTDGGR